MARTFVTLATTCTFVASGWAQQSSTPTFEQLRTIVIDPGHGGEDLGAIGVAGVLEKELTLAVAIRLRDRLAESNPELQVVLTRADDTYPTLSERLWVANTLDADLFVSIHFNAAANTLAEGIETYYLAPAGTVPGEVVPGFEDCGPAHPHAEVGVAGDLHSTIVEDLVRTGAIVTSAQVAESVQESLLAVTDATDRDVRQAQFRVLRGARMPAIVVELGFLTHAREGMRLVDVDYHELLVDGLVEALLDYDSWALARASELESDVRVAQGAETSEAEHVLD